MNHRFKFMLSLCILVPGPVNAQSEEQGAVPAQQGAGNENLTELLEFLGEFETEQGNWISPVDLVQDIYTELDAPTRVIVTTDNDENENTE